MRAIDRVCIVYATAMSVFCALVACTPPPMGATDPVTNGNRSAQIACVDIDAGAGATVSATKSAIDECRCEAKAVHGEPCDVGGAP